MNTVVFQSFRSHDVPRYIADCCESVRTWAEMAGYAYQFLDDTFLDLVPAWYRHKAGGSVCVVADLARLIQAQHLLLSGVDRVVWCDADLFVFRPEQFALAPSWTGAYCQEVWFYRDGAGNPGAIRKVNNAMCVFTGESLGHLAEYIEQCCAVVHATPMIGDLSVGTNLLTGMHASRAVIATVGMVSSHLMEAILDDDLPALAQYVEWQGSPVYAANLCNAMRRGFGTTPKLFDFLCAAVVEKLAAGSAGAVLSEDRSESVHIVNADV